jgi:hypothetical protein
MATLKLPNKLCHPHQQHLAWITQIISLVHEAMCKQWFQVSCTCHEVVQYRWTHDKMGTRLS